MIVDSGRHRLQPGVGLLVSPLRLHHYDSAPRRGLCWLFFTFELPPPDLSPRRASPDSRRQRSALCPLLSHFGQTKGPRVSAARRSARWLLSCLSSWASLLTKIKTWIEDGEEAGLVLGALSRHVGLSESRLRTWFRQQFGLSLGRYILETRCRQAAQRLKIEGLGVAEVATDLGFSSAFSFSRTFKSVLGVSPSRFAKTT